MKTSSRLLYGIIIGILLSLISGCGVARNMEEWQRESETFRQLDAAYEAGKISEKEYFELKAKLMNKNSIKVEN
jgi:hypothetical protein